MRDSLRRSAPSAALALGLLYVGLALLHVWEASRHLTPTVFTDEIEFTQLSRAVADTGTATYRDGAPAPFPSLYVYLAAPAWWLGSVADSYEAIKTLGALLMTAALFPAYGLARLVAGRWLSVAAAAGTAAAPALVYGPFLVDEPLAYPVATLALFLIARWLARPTIGRLAAATAACLLGPLARTQLSVLLVVLAIGGAVVLWRSERARRLRVGWTIGDWVGAATLALGAVLVGLAFVSRRSTSWYVATTFYKGRMLDFGLWANGALALGLGLVPFLATLAALASVRGRTLTDGERGFAVTAAASLGSFTVYAAVKGAYLSTTFASLVPERNVVYLTPILFAGTAWLLDRRAARLWALVGACALAIWLIVDTPFGLSYPNYEAHGFSMLTFANRVLRWDDTRLEHVLIVVAIVVTILLAVLSSSTRRVARPLGIVLIAATLVWTTSAEIYGARGENELTARFYGALPKPPDWLDRVDGDKRAVFLGQSITDANALWSLEFWNRSLKRMWSLDASAPGPGRVLTGELAKPDGTIHPSPETDWIVANRGVALRPAPGRRVVGDYVVQPLHGPIRLGSAVYGIYPDGWMGEKAAYDRYDVEPGERGLASITVSRIGWCGKDKPAQVTVKLGPLGVTPDRHPVIRRVTQIGRGVLNSCEQLPVFLFRAPPGPWRAEVEVTPTFSPHELDPQLGDARQLGAQVSFDYRPFSA